MTAAAEQEIALADDAETEETEAHTEKRSRSTDAFSTEQLRCDLSINDADLDGAMTEQAGLYGHYSTLYAHAQYKADFFENKAKLAKAKAYKEIRNRLLAKGAKFSEAMLEAEVVLHEGYQDAQELALKHKMNAELCRHALEALKQRRDMLVQKGKSRLEEFKGELYLKGPAGSRLDLEDKKAKAMAVRSDSK